MVVEGMLSLHTGVPAIAWEEWSRDTAARGLTPQEEEAYRGRHIEALQHALRVFEIHPDQCGVVVYVADDLASVHVAPHPHDYRALHASLVSDLYGELLHVNGLMTPESPPLYVPLAAREVRDLTGLRRAVAESRTATLRAHDALMLSSLVEESYDFRPVHRHGELVLSRFLPPFVRGRLAPGHRGHRPGDGPGRVAAHPGAGQVGAPSRPRDAPTRPRHTVGLRHDRPWVARGEGRRPHPFSAPAIRPRMKYRPRIR